MKYNLLATVLFFSTKYILNLRRIAQANITSPLDVNNTSLASQPASLPLLYHLPSPFILSENNLKMCVLWVELCSPSYVEVLTPNTPECTLWTIADAIS